MFEDWDSHILRVAQLLRKSAVKKVDGVSIICRPERGQILHLQDGHLYCGSFQILSTEGSPNSCSTGYLTFPKAKHSKNRRVAVSYYVLTLDS